MPKMPEIEKVTSVYTSGKLRHISDEDGGNNSFAQVLDQEEKKQNRREAAKEESKMDENLAGRLAGRMNSYNCHAVVAFFTMAYSTTDLRG